MRLAVALLVLCAFAAAAEARSVSQQRSERNLLTSAISGIQHAVGSAVGGVLNGAGNAIGGALNAGGEFAHNAIGVAEDAAVAAIHMAEQLAEKLVHHNAFAVRILQCLSGAAERTAHGAADVADGTVDQVKDAAEEALNVDGDQKRNVLQDAAGAVRDCVVDSLHQSVQNLQEKAHKIVGDTSGMAVTALETLKQAIEKNVKANSTVLQSLDGAFGLAEEVVKNLTNKADDVVDNVADKADDVLDNVPDGSHSKRNILNDLLDQMKASLADNLAEWIKNATNVAESKAQDIIAQAEKAADEALQKAHGAIDDNLVEGSDWEKILEELLQKAEAAEQQLSNKAEGAVQSAVEVAKQIADSISNSKSNSA